MATYQQKLADVERKWHVVDATDIPLGRLSTRVATLLRGKHKPTWAPHLDNGDFVIVVNASKVKLTGNKLEQKMHHHHSGYPGGLKSTPYKVVMQKYPDRAIRWSVEGMLPKNRLANKLAKRLKVYVGEKHPHQAQMPSEFTIE